MTAAFFHLGERFFYRIVDFARHWYVKSIRMYWNFFLDRLEEIDYYLAWKITLKNLFQPMYGDRSFFGRFFGFFFRLFRLIIGGAVYAVLFVVAVGLYVAWAAAPLYLIARAIEG